MFLISPKLKQFCFPRNIINFTDHFCLKCKTYKRNEFSHYFPDSNIIFVLQLRLNQLK